MKILIISHCYPPLNSMGSLRPYYWAKYWKMQGHEVKVLTTKKKSFDGELNLFVSSIPDVEVFEVDYFSSVGKSNKNINGYSISKPRINSLKIILRKIRRMIGSLFDIHDYWVKHGVRVANEIYNNWKYDLIVSSFSPPASHKIASILTKRHNAFWVADFRDLWSQNHVFRARWPFSMYERFIEKKVISSADLITVASEPFKAKLLERYEKTIITIENGYEIEKDYLSDRKKYLDNNKVSIVYCGNIYSGKQDPSTLFMALSDLLQTDMELSKKIEVCFFGYHLGNVHKLVDKYNVHSIVRTNEGVPREISIQLQKEANALLFLDWIDSENDVIPGKIFEYIFSNRPIISIGGYAESATNSLILETNTGYICGRQIESIKNILIELIDYKYLKYSPNQELIKRYTRKKLALKMIDHISDQLGKEN